MHSPRRIHRERRLQQPTSEHRRTDSRPLIASLSSC
jgi:hypothetical protein